MLSITQFAKLKGVSRQAIYKALSDGRLTYCTALNGRRLIDPNASILFTGQTSSVYPDTTKYPEHLIKWPFDWDTDELRPLPELPELDYEYLEKIMPIFFRNGTDQENIVSAYLLGLMEVIKTTATTGDTTQLTKLILNLLDWESSLQPSDWTLRAKKELENV